MDENYNITSSNNYNWMKTIILPVQLVQPQAQLKYQFLMELKINIFKLNLLFYPKNISAVL